MIIDKIDQGHRARRRRQSGFSRCGRKIKIRIDAAAHHACHATYRRYHCRALVSYLMTPGRRAALMPRDDIEV